MKPIHLLLIVPLLLFSCKKKEDVNPSPVAVDDTYFMYDPETERICPVLENDHYTGKPVIPPFSYLAIKGVFETVDSSTVSFRPFKNAYGNFECTYTLNDQKGNAQAKLKVRRGTNEQIITSNLIAPLTNYRNENLPYERVYYLYAIDDDTSYFYKNTYDHEYVRFELANEIIIKSSYLPTIEGLDEYYDYYSQANYSIDTEGVIHATDDADQEVSFKMLGTFSDIAIKPGETGTLQVHGFTIGYQGKRYDFAMWHEIE